MRAFQCVCGARVFFENTQCLTCGRELRFSPQQLAFVPLADQAERNVFIGSCANLEAQGCNWLVTDEDEAAKPDRNGPSLCLACRLNLPTDAAMPERDYLVRTESAKRRLLLTLLELGLPIVPKHDHEDGLGFRLDKSGDGHTVTIGHEHGVITLDLIEADPAEKERVRIGLGESYRTLLGHFRHESGHYYWDLLFGNCRAGLVAPIDEFRSLFGDERTDYQAALKKHYEAPELNFAPSHVSAYATSHPWEDWAETWAHYLHIRDSWQTAQSFGLTANSQAQKGAFRLGQTIDAWCELMVALNSLNRSMGHYDAYPFEISTQVRDKLQFVERMIDEHAAQVRAMFSAAPVSADPVAADRIAVGPGGAGPVTTPDDGPRQTA